MNESQLTAQSRKNEKPELESTPLRLARALAHDRVREDSPKPVSRDCDLPQVASSGSYA